MFKSLLPLLPLPLRVFPTILLSTPYFLRISSTLHPLHIPSILHSLRIFPATSLLLILFSMLIFFLSPGTALATHCAYNTAGETVTVADGGINVDIFVDADFGTTVFQGLQMTYCVGEDNGGGNVTIEFLSTTGTVLNSQSAADNTHYNWTPNTTYIGPVRLRVGATTSNYFMFIAPPPPIQAVNCTGPNNSCFTFANLPSYAIGGEVYNAIFNTRLDSLTTIPTNGAYPNPALARIGIENNTIPGVYAEDTTYISSTSYIILYWWLKAGPEGFPDWSVQFENEVKHNTGAVIDLEALSEQFRTFTPNSDYFGYIVLLADNAAASLAATGWWAQIAPALVGSDPTQFYGTWRPINSGVYGEGSQTIPEELNGGYLFLTEASADKLLSGMKLTLGSGLLKEGDSAISGEVNFYPRTGASFVNYVVELRDFSGQQMLESVELANTDGITTTRVPFSFYRIAFVSSGKVVLREEINPKYPALVQTFSSSTPRVKLGLLAPFQGLSNFVNSVSQFGFSQKLTQASTAFGTNVSIGSLLLALIPTLIIVIWLYSLTRSMTVVGITAILLSIFFMLVGLLPPAWLLLPLWLAIGFGVGWKVFVERLSV